MCPDSGLLAALAAVIAGLLSWAAPATALSAGGDPLVLNAQLRASDAPIPLGPASVSGQTIVASGTAYIGGRIQDVVYVFTRPAGGWSDTAKPTAMLVASDGGGLGGPVAISGGTVVAGDEHVGGTGGRVHRAGWRLVRDGARVGPADRFGRIEVSVAWLGGRSMGGRSSRVATAVSAAAVPGEAYVFTEPAGGWSGTLPESAKLFASAGRDRRRLRVTGGDLGSDDRGRRTKRRFCTGAPGRGKGVRVHRTARRVVRQAVRASHAERLERQCRSGSHFRAIRHSSIGKQRVCDRGSSRAQAVAVSVRCTCFPRRLLAGRARSTRPTC